jgi:hypothetical protein
MSSSYTSVMLKYILTLLTLYPWCLTAQDYSTLDVPKRSADELKRDLTLLWQGIDRYHSGAYWYTPRDTMITAFAEAEAQLVDSMTVLDFHRLVAPLVALTREDHADVFLPQAVRRAVLESAPMFPLSVVFLDRRMYCVLDGSPGESDLRGAEILSINEQDPRELVRQIGQLFSSDGFIERVKYSDLSGLSFSYYHYLEFGEVPTFDIRYRTLDGAIQVTQLAAHPLRTIRQAIRDRYPLSVREEPELPPVAFEILNDSTAYLAVHTFSKSELRKIKGHAGYRDFLATSFRTIAEKGIERLIIDVSQNSGGAEGNENLLYSYLGPNYQKYEKVRVKTERMVFDNGIDPPLRTRVFPFWERWCCYVRMPDGSYTRKANIGHGLRAYKREPKHKFNGELFVLISPVTYSGGSEFANMIYTQQRATFFGEETGGGFYGNTSGYAYLLELPHSGIKINLPALQFVMKVEGLPFGSGVIPHQQIIPDIETYLQGEAAVRQFILSRIE